MSPSQIAHAPPEEIVGREPDEWIGATPDTPVPDRVKLRVFRRWNGICYLSGVKIRGGDAWDMEHVKALGLGGENRESNLRPALKAPHVVKTAADRDRMAKADRIARKNLGLWPEPKRKMQSRPFPGGRGR